MALLTATRPTAAGVVCPGTPVSASDTISVTDLGSRGAYLAILNAGASPDNVTVSDSSLTPVGNPAQTTANTVAAGTNEVMYISPRAVNTATGLVTVTHTFTTSVTCVLLPLE